MSDFAGKFQALADAVAGMAETQDARRRVRLPGEPHDRSLEALREKVNEIIRYLEDLSRILPNTTPDQAAIAEIGQDLDQALQQRGGAGQMMIPGQNTPGGFGQENLRQAPVRKFGKVVECYDSGGNVWVSSSVSGVTLTNAAAYYCKVNPSGPEQGGYVDTATELYIEFPFFFPDAGSDIRGIGVTYCPVGTIISYFEHRRPSELHGHVISGMETGAAADSPAGKIALRNLPYILKTGSGQTPLDSNGWGVYRAPMLEVVSIPAEDYLLFTGTSADFDACGRMVCWKGASSILRIKAHVDIDGVPKPVHFSEWTP